MLDWLKVFQAGQHLRGTRLGILTGPGGSGVLMADSASAAGLTVPETPDHDRASIEKLVPVFGSARSSVDVTAQAIAAGIGQLSGNPSKGLMPWSWDRECAATSPWKCRR